VIVRVFEDKLSLSLAAADQAANAVRRAILDRGRARIIAATGTSQLDFLDALTRAENIDWQRVEMSMNTSGCPLLTRPVFASTFLSG